MSVPAQLLAWPLRRWLVSAATTLGLVLVVAIPTNLIDTPYFTRDVPVTWWAWPALLSTSVLAGLLTATYVSPVAGMSQDVRARRGGWVGAVLTFFAVGCPVCNKLVLLALGYGGALAWFQPVQPLLQLLALALLVWALIVRLRGETSCALEAIRA